MSFFPYVFSNVVFIRVDVNEENDLYMFRRAQYLERKGRMMNFRRGVPANDKKLVAIIM